MRFLVLSTVDVSDDTDELVDHDVVDSTLKMQLQILPFITVELSTGNDDAYFLWEPSRHCPKMLVFHAVDGSIDNQYFGDALNRLPCVELLVPLASVAPTSGLVLSLHTSFENLGE